MEKETIMSEVLDNYKTLMTEIVAKQTVILGPDISVLKARNVAGLEINDRGEILNIEGDPQDLLQKLVNEYVELSGLIVKNALGSIFDKYPSIKKII